jgi:hypothetical protein
MARKSAKSAKTDVVAFKVEAELAALLNKLPNKSAFIRKAIVSHLGVECPLCRGSGVVPRGVHDHYSAMLGKLNHRNCDGCGHPLSLPQEPGELAPPDRRRLEQFFHGGPLYCDGCYVKAPECDECGWHIAEKQAIEHYKREHAAH